MDLPGNLSLREEMSDFLLNAYPSRRNGTRNWLCQQDNISDTFLL